ncbi:MAG: hypothetical protein JXA77_08375 [Bacteroidales bacterium]|nr:hypothetical protein [Bacteroidales bacterium]MBN2820946.1 hypothetical protein [Bacteroidales bacterium]
MKKYRLILAASLLIIIIAGVLYYTFRKSPESVENIKPDYIVEATALVDEFSENESEANTKYLNKTIQAIQVSGVVLEVNETAEERITIYLEGNLMGNVSCAFSNKEIKNIPDIGEKITVKGKCTGYILDVKLIKCALVD